MVHDVKFTMTASHLQKKISILYIGQDLHNV
jgi:hypothetical protein